MTNLMIVEVFTVMFLATVFRTTFGFGEALIAVPLLALIIPIKIAAPVAVLASIFIALFIVWRDWRHIHFLSAGWLIFSTLFGIPIGLIILKTVSESVVKMLLAVIIILFSMHSFIFSSKRLLLKDDRFAWIFGFIAGICGGSYGVNGPPLAIYGSLRDWAPERFRATLQGYFLPASILGMCGYGVTGLWTRSVNVLFLWSLPAIIVGIFVGRIISNKIDAKRFEYYVRFGLILVALVLLFQSQNYWHYIASSKSIIIFSKNP